MSAAIWSERVTVEHGRALVAPPTILDLLSYDTFTADLAAADRASASGDVVVMMGGVESCDEDGFGALIGAFRRATARGAHVYVLRAPDHMLARLARTGMIGQFKLIESLGELAPAVAAGSASV